MNYDCQPLEETVLEAGSASGVSDSHGFGRRIKNTTSICPDCLEAISAQVFERQGGIWMDKECIHHGRFSALLSSDARH